MNPVRTEHVALMAWRACQAMRQTSDMAGAIQAKTMLGDLSRLGNYPAVARFAQRQIEDPKAQR